MKNLVLIVPEKPSKVLLSMINSTIENYNAQIVENEVNLPNLENKKIIFAIELNDSGININLFKILLKLHKRGSSCLKGSTAIILIHSNTELYTKTTAQSIVLRTNQMGCRFPGRPIVEATGSLNNLMTMQKAMNIPIKDVLSESCKKLGKRLIDDNPTIIKKPNILILHASNRKTSNTLTLWDMVEEHMPNVEITEIHIENGTVRDCIGCQYKTCKHYGKQTSCFYGGIMVEEIYPAILNSDAIIWICPNYNDAITANLTAVINRLTALFRKTKFYDKTIFGIIVSGHSGSDALAKQLISALNMNKTFRLPPYFALMATANDKGAIYNVPNIKQKAKDFAQNIINEIKA